MLVQDSIRDYAVLQRIMRQLKTRKAPWPGPDEIHNEMLKHFPPSVHQALLKHSLFTLMWMTGTTPGSWKESNTILLHNKNDESLLEFYRPIALANTMLQAMDLLATTIHAMLLLEEVTVSKPQFPRLSVIVSPVMVGREQKL